MKKQKIITGGARAALSVLLAAGLCFSSIGPALAGSLPDREQVTLDATASLTDKTRKNREDAAGAEESLPGEPVLKREGSYYFGSLIPLDTTPVYQLPDEPDVPYIPVRTFNEAVFKSIKDKGASYEWDGAVYRISRGSGCIEFDLDSQSVAYQDFYGYCDVQGGVANGFVDPGQEIPVLPSKENPSTVTSQTPFGFDLKAYPGARMIRLGDELLMPFCYAQDLLCGPLDYCVFSFNGDDFFEVVQNVGNIYGNGFDTDTMNPYSDQYYSGSFCSRKELSQAYANYYYGSLCLFLDMVYGHKEEKGITTFDAYFEENGLKEAFLTPDPMDDDAALSKLYLILFDSGHDGEILSSSIINSQELVETAKKNHKMLDLLGYESGALMQEDLGKAVSIIKEIISLTGLVSRSEVDKLINDFFDQMEENDVFGEGNREILQNSLWMLLIKPLGYGSSRVDFSGDTAVIYFETFLEDMVRGESFYAKLPSRADYETSTFALFYDAFRQIKENPEIKRVVLDISANGGGYASTLVELLGFLSENGEVTVTHYDMMNQSDHCEHYHVDTNLDGRFDNLDGYGGDYEFYILTSGNSYSCGNALPYFAQRQGLAKIIGEKPGGGDCVVSGFVDACGHIANISAFLKIGERQADGSFISDEKAVTIDYPFTEADKEIFYAPEKIADYVRRVTQ